MSLLCWSCAWPPLLRSGCPHRACRSGLHCQGRAAVSQRHINHMNSWPSGPDARGLHARHAQTCDMSQCVTAERASMGTCVRYLFLHATRATHRRFDITGERVQPTPKRCTFRCPEKNWTHGRSGSHSTCQHPHGWLLTPGQDTLPRPHLTLRNKSRPLVFYHCPPLLPSRDLVHKMAHRTPAGFGSSACSCAPVFRSTSNPLPVGAVGYTSPSSQRYRSGWVFGC